VGIWDGVFFGRSGAEKVVVRRKRASQVSERASNQPEGLGSVSVRLRGLVSVIEPNLRRARQQPEVGRFDRPNRAKSRRQPTKPLSARISNIPCALHQASCTRES
jgi:hypothetical protein